MNDTYRLSINDLYAVLSEWDEKLKSKVFVAACGGTALTLYGHKESTKDVDFLIPDPAQYDHLIKTLKEMGYTLFGGHSYKHYRELWIFDLFRGQTIFQTELLDPIQQAGKHRVIRKLERLELACINPDDLIISKMFRGTSVDVDDSIIMITSENVNLSQLAARYRETAGYYFNPTACKTHLGYLIAELNERKIDATPLMEMSETWNP